MRGPHEDSEPLTDPVQPVDSGSSQRRFGPPAGHTRRFGEPTHTTTYTMAEAPCGHQLRIFNDAYEGPVEVDCYGPGDTHRWAVVVHTDANGIPVAFFARL